MQVPFENAPRPLTLSQELVLSTHALIKVLPGDLYSSGKTSDSSSYSDVRYSVDGYDGYPSDAKELFEVGANGSAMYAYIEWPAEADGLTNQSTGYIIECGDEEITQIEQREYHPVSVADQLDTSMKVLIDSTRGLSPQYADELTKAMEAARQTWDDNREPLVSEPRDMTHVEKLGLLTLLRTKLAQYTAE